MQEKTFCTFIFDIKLMKSKSIKTRCCNQLKWLQRGPGELQGLHQLHFQEAIPKKAKLKSFILNQL